MITNRMYLESASLVGVRQWFATHFHKIFVLDLRGSSEESRRIPRLSTDENVFDILQGVAVSFLVRHRATATEPGTAIAREVVGTRQDKYRSLAENLTCSKTVGAWFVLDRPNGTFSLPKPKAERC